MIGKKIRMDRSINRDSGKTVIIPMDHGIAVGPMAGLIKMEETVNAVAIENSIEGSANQTMSGRPWLK